MHNEKLIGVHLDMSGGGLSVGECTLTIMAAINEGLELLRKWSIMEKLPRGADYLFLLHINTICSKKLLIGLLVIALLWSMVSWRVWGWLLRLLAAEWPFLLMNTIALALT
jgi:hypothetical protein